MVGQSTDKGLFEQRLGTYVTRISTRTTRECMSRVTRDISDLNRRSQVTKTTLDKLL